MENENENLKITAGSDGFDYRLPKEKTKITVGEKYGALTIVKILGKKVDMENRNFYVDCVCECGKNKTARYSHLKSGKIVSCGCKKIGVKKETKQVDKERTFKKIDSLKKANDKLPDKIESEKRLLAEKIKQIRSDGIKNIATFNKEIERREKEIKKYRREKIKEMKMIEEDIVKSSKKEMRAKIKDLKRVLSNNKKNIKYNEDRLKR